MREAAAGGSSRGAEAVRLHLRRALRCDFTLERATAQERALLAAAPAPVTAERAQDYLAWRRSMAWVGLVPAALVVLGNAVDWIESFGEENVTSGYRALLLGHVLASAALLYGFGALALRWREGDLTRRRLGLGWLVHFLGPILLSLVPLLDFVQGAEQFSGPVPDLAAATARLEQGIGTEADQQATQLWVGRMVWEAFRVGIGLALLLNLAPTFLALFPGITRAGLTVKTLLPGRSLSAAVAALMAPVYAAGFLLSGVLLQQLGGSVVLAVGLLLFLWGPIQVTRRGADLARPLGDEAAGALVRQVRRRAAVFVGLGGVLILVSAFLMEVLGMRLVGFGDRALLGPLGVGKILLAYAANLTALSVVASDALLRGMRAADRHAERNAGSADAARDRGRLGEVVAVLEPPAAGARPSGPAAGA